MAHSAVEGVRCKQDFLLVIVLRELGRTKPTSSEALALAPSVKQT